MDYLGKWGYNILHSDGSTLVRIDGIDYASVMDWQKSDFLSIGNQFEIKPIFVSSNDLHLSTSMVLPKGKNLGINDDIDGDPRCSYAVSIGADEVLPAPPITMQFQIPDSVFVNELVSFVDTASNASYQTYFLKINNVYVDSFKNPVFTHTFKSTGKYKLTIIGRTCTGIDSIIKNIYVKKVSEKPIADFQLPKRILDIEEKLQIFNQSKNGVSDYSWSISPARYQEAPGYWKPSFGYAAGTDSTSANPVIVFYNSGKYDLCLTVKNALGADTKCLIKAVAVRNVYRMCLDGFESNDDYGRLTGPKGPYQSFFGQYDCGFTIRSCKNRIVLYFNKFNFCSDGNCLLGIYAGTDDTTGTPLHNYLPAFSKGLNGDKSQVGFQDSLVVNSSALYLRFHMDTKSRDGYFDLDISWVARGSTNGAQPVVDFAIPDTICTETPLYIEPESKGSPDLFEWKISSDNTNPISIFSKTLNEIFFFPGSYVVTLIASNCFGIDYVTKTIEIVEPARQLTPKIEINNRHPKADEIIQLRDVSTVEGHLCSQSTEWEITPDSYTLHSRDLKSRVLDISFSDTVCYDIKLIAWNAFGEDSVMDKCGVSVKGITTQSYDVANKYIKVYPNPGKDFIFIEAPTKGNLFVYTMQGSLALESNLTAGNTKLSVADLPSGLYLFHLIQSNMSSLQQLVLIEE